jgi:PAS domain S-box-containing protein
MRLARTVCCSVLALVIASSVAHAQAPVKVGVHPSDPFVIADDQGRMQGLCVDILEYIAAQKGWQIQYVPGTIAEGLTRLDRGEIDLFMPLAWSPQNAVRYDFSREGVLSTCGQLYVARQSAVLSLNDVAGKVVAVMKGDPHYGNFRLLLEDLRLKCEFVEMANYRQVLEAVENRRVDAGLVERLYGVRHEAAYRIDRTSITTAPVEMRFAAPRSRNRVLLDPLDYWVDLLHADPGSAYFRALAHWTDYRPHRSAVPWIIGILTLTTLLLVGGVAGIVWQHRQVRQHVTRLTASNAQLRRELVERDRIEEALGIREQWYRTLFNNNRDAAVAYGFTADGMPTRFIEVNDTACVQLEYSREELSALTPQDIESSPAPGAMPTYSQEELVTLSAANIAARGKTEAGHQMTKLILERKHVTYERMLRKKSGTEIPVEITVHLFQHLDQPMVLYTFHDITHRRETERALRESEWRFRDFFARSPIGIAIYNAQRELTDVNQACLRMFGFNERTQFGQVNLFDSPDLPADAKKTLVKGGTVRFEAGFDFDHARKMEWYNSNRSGKCHFDVLITNLGLDEEFNPKGFLVQVRDVTEQRKTEEALLQSERHLRQAQKMEAIGTLAGGIAHDFNNILTPILGYTEMALLNFSGADQVRQHLEEVLKASHRAKDLVNQILTFSRQTEKEWKPMQLVPVIKEVLMLLRASLLPNIEVRYSIHTDRDIVRADPTQMHQVLMNLCTNAMHAMRDRGGVLDVQLRQITVDARSRGALARLTHGTYIDLTVADTGTGMDRPTMERIFEPFFTTKRGGEGTGMGLAVVHGIITSLKGTITVESEVGKGSVFHIVLPLLEQAMENPTAVSGTLPSGTECVLFVDDENDIVQMASHMLISLGYTPVLCTQSLEALQTFRENPGRFDIVITDQIMPAMVGTDMAREMIRLRPDIPIILCTGFSKTVTPQEAQEAGIREFLMKPIILRQLADAIRRVLDQKPAKEPA